MDSLDERFTQALHGGARAWRGALERQLRASGLTMAGWSAMAVVLASAAPPSQRELARRLGVDGATLVATIDRLAGASLVERMPSPNDRRVKLVVATERGKVLAAEIERFTAALRQEVMARIDSERIIVAAGVLEELRAILELERP
jgi:MarR family transcriptional regulator for hemolysin